MPTTIRLSDNRAEDVTHRGASSRHDIFARSCSSHDGRNLKRLLKSSFDEPLQKHIHPAHNGFVLTVIQAYNKHHSLILRPDDIWITILTQIGFYVRANAEELKSLFVDHDSQVTLKTVDPNNGLATANIGRLALQFTEQMAKLLKEPDQLSWYMPSFSTTTETDAIVACVVLMSAMEAFFAFDMHLRCGIPNVTLQGERADWVNIQHRLDKLRDPSSGWGSEVVEFAERLATVLNYFVLAFDNPIESRVVDFWAKIAHHRREGSGPNRLSGWITAFCHWNMDGGRIETARYANEADGVLYVDGTSFQAINIEHVPFTQGSVPVNIYESGILRKTRMIAGLVGYQVAPWTSKGTRARENKAKKWLSRWTNRGVKYGNTLQPVSGWWMYELDENEEQEAQPQQLC